MVQGNNQAAEPGDVLPVLLNVRVQKKGSWAGAEGVRVRWEILQGAGAVADPQVSETDSLGLAAAQLTLGPGLGAYTVQASVRGMESPPVEFSAEAILVPELTWVPSGPSQAGETISVQGVNFDPSPEQNLVTFSGIRARVVSATTTELGVEVPPCLVARGYEVRVGIGALVTEAAHLEVGGGTSSLLLGPGEDRVLDGSEGFNCVHLPSGPGVYYLAIPHSTSTLGGAEFGFSLVSLTTDGAFPSPSFSPPTTTSDWKDPVAPAPVLIHGALSGSLPDAVREAQDRWYERIRGLEAELAAEGSPLPHQRAQPGSQPEGVSAIPAVGDKRTFKVLNSRNGFTKVTARVRYVTDHSLIYLDEKVPNGGFSDPDLAILAQEFEDPVHPTITGAFGHESDMDGNGRVIVLFTDAVNSLTEEDSDGFVAGFFFGLDLYEGRTGSNKGEIFYAMVPDPAGEKGPAIGKNTALNAIPAVLAHEFEHMVHFNQRMLLGRAEVSEALWLSEALAQMAEDLVGQAFEMAYNSSKAYQYQSGNFIRAQRFLKDPSQVSVLASVPPGTLAERGAGWLLLKQLFGRPDQEDLLRSLVSATSSGVENLTAAVGLEWQELVADWAGALVFDGTSVPVRAELRVSGVNLRRALLGSDGTYPLKPLSFGEESARFSGTLWSSAPNYFIISPPTNGGLALSAGGPMGGIPEAAMGLQLLLVRLQ